MIVVISRVKNSADIIESWVRGNSLVADKFVVIDNNSTDGTTEILTALKAEGFDIEIIEADDPFVPQRDQMNWLMNYVYENYEPDIVLPFDDDEILASEIIPDIKNYLLRLPPDKIYKVRWRVYTMVGKENQQDPCVIRRISHCFIHNEHEFPTVILTKKVLEYGGYLLTQGNHGLKRNDDKKDIHEIEFLSDLYLAHFPLRSEAQVMSKFLVGWTNYLTIPLKEDMMENSYWCKIYNNIKHYRSLSPREILLLSGLYRQEHGNGYEFIDQIADQKVALPHSCFDIRYFRKVDPWFNYMCNTESIARKLAEINKKAGMEDFTYDFNTGDNKM